jgi:hypothetical protein
MLIKDAHNTRQSPMQKFAAFGENSLKVIGAVKGAYDVGQQVMAAGRAAYGVAQAVAPYAAVLL